jgi:hypothetical protein
VFGYCHISRKSHLNQLQRTLTRKSGWNVTFKMIGITGKVVDSYVEPILEIFPQKYEINTIHLDFDIKKITIDYQSPNDISNTVFEMLVNLQKNLNFQIRIKLPNESESRSVSSFLEDFKSSAIQPFYNIPQPDLKDRVHSLLPSWIKSPKIESTSKGIILSVKNDFSDNERLQFLQILLDSQLGYPIQINQVYSFEDQIQALKEIIKAHIQDFTIVQDIDSEKVTIRYSDFPIKSKIIKELKENTKKRAKLVIKFDSVFEQKSENISLEIKNYLENFPEIEYSFVFFDIDKQKFIILLPEECKAELDLETVKESLKQRFLFPIDLQWVEDDPVIYLEKRIFIGSDEEKRLRKIKYDEKEKLLRIYYKKPKELEEDLWRKIFFRFAKFQVEFIDPKTKNRHDIFSFPFFRNLESTDLIDYLLKFLPPDLKLRSINYDISKDAYIVKHDNLLIKEQLKQIKVKLSDMLQIDLFFVPARDPEQIIYSLVSILPDWFYSPRVTYDEDNHVLKLRVQNDFEDETALQEWVTEKSHEISVPIVPSIVLPNHRIKQIISTLFKELIEIIRLKIYPEKSQVYLEGIMRSGEDEEMVEEVKNRIEVKTHFTIESYIKKSKISGSRRQTVHDILQELINSYKFSESFPLEVIEQSKSIKEFDTKGFIPDRVDLRDWDCFSIDPIGSKAIDDVISIQRLTHPNKEDDILIGIHIVDVSHFLKKNSLLDQEAKRRSFTVYVDRNQYYPLFPEDFIRKISLAEGVDRLSVSLLIELTLEGNIVDFWLKRSIINNKRQFSYPEVNENLLEQKGHLLTDLQLLVSITNQLRYHRISQGSINLDFIPDNPADQVIQELMILANRLVAFYMQNLPGQKVFRNQHIPSYAYPAIKRALSSYNYHLDILNKHPLTDLNRILSESVIRGENQLIIRELKRFLSNAYYSHTSNGHEALGTKWYTQWTSPLRRYIDIIVHRLLFNQYIDELTYQCQYASAVERVIKIRFEQDFLENKEKYIQQYIDKPIKGRLLRVNKRQAVLSLNQIKALIIARFIDSNLIYLETENAIELSGEIFKPRQEVTCIIYQLNIEKRDLIIKFSLLSSSEGISHPEALIRAKVVFER